MSEAGRLYWKCRRGSLELDLILLNFYEKSFPTLSTEDQDIFEQLLDEQDPVLSSWLYGDQLPASPDFQRIVSVIKSHGVKF